MRYFLTILFLGFSSHLFSQTHTAITYNLRLNIESDGINKWENRKHWLTNQVKDIAPDILGTQEGLPDQIAFLDSSLINYDFVGVGRADGEQKGEFSAIFYNSEKLETLQEGTFWLSETPDIVSTGWDAALPRICTYILFNDIENDKTFWVFNTHLDHKGAVARLESLRLIWQKIQTMNSQNYPVILMGDLNAVPESAPISFLSKKMSDSREVSKTKPNGPFGTYNGFDTTHKLDERIDYIFVNDGINVQGYRVANDIRDKRTPSDHLPIIIDFTLSPSK